MTTNLSDRQKRFCNEFLVDMNATAAYKRAGYAAQGNAAEAAASRLLSNAKVQAYIAEKQKALAIRTEITQDMVLQRWWQIATADPNDLIYHRRVCCRHCFGLDHEFQWADVAEFEQACLVAAMEDRPAPTDYGGYGFDKTIRPHPKCPQCKGEGFGQVQVSDTRDLSPQARMLYAGVKQTINGIEIKMADQDKALENVARHLGMFKDKLELSGDDKAPLQVMFNIPRPPAKPEGS